MRDIEMHVADPCVPTLSPQEHYAHIYQENSFRASVPGGDPLTGRVWSVDVSVMLWNPREEGEGESFFIAIDPDCDILRHHITPDGSMDECGLPYHISLGWLTRRQAKRVNRLLANHRYRLTVQVAKWAVPGLYQTGYILTGGSLLQVPRRVEGKFGMRPPLGAWHISM